MSDSTITNQKASLRREIRERIREMSDLQRQSESSAIRARIAKRLETASSQTILLFSPLKEEPRVSDLFRSLLDAGHRVALPLITDNAKRSMVMRAISHPDELIRGPLGILQPDPNTSALVAVGEIDIAFIPAWAYSKSTGARLGKGGGFYDRFCASPEWRAQTLGVAFRCQILDHVPCESHDMCVEEIVTADEWVIPHEADS